MERIGIVGYHQVRPELDLQMSPYECIFTAVRGALDHSGLKRKDITTVISATNDYYDGKTISNCFKVSAGGAYMKDESKVEMDGAHAAQYAMFRILSQNHKLAMVYGFSMPSCMLFETTRILELDPTFDRPISLMNGYSTCGMQMRAYMKKYGVSEEQIAEATATNWKNAAKNPLALKEAQKADMTAAEVLKSDYLASPLRELMYPLLGDGCTALILAPEKQALKITDNPIWITGVGNCQETYYFGERDLTTSLSMEKASEAAYKMAGVKASDIDVAELFGYTACEDIILAESAGLAEKGKGDSLIAKNCLNPSGGATSGMTPCATGLNRIIEAVKQLKGEADGHQVSGAKKAIASGQIGLCAQNNIIYVLEGGN